MARVTSAFRILWQNPCIIQSFLPSRQFASIAIHSQSLWNNGTSNKVNLTPNLKAGNYCSQTAIQRRNCSSQADDKSDADSSQQNDEGRVLLMDIEPQILLRPRGIFRGIYGWLAYTFGITSVDKEFRIEEFLDGAGQAMQMVSQNLADGNYEALDGLITEDALKIIKKNIKRMTLKQRNEIRMYKENIIRTNWYKIKLSEDRNVVPAKRFAEITVLIHAVKAKPDKEVNSLKKMS